MENITISKELLENVLNWDLDRKKFYSDHNIKDNLISVYFFQPDSTGKTGTHYWQTTNIYEFAFKCKVWAYKKGYTISDLPYSIRIYKNGYEVYSTNTELYSLDMFFKACNWILEQTI